MLEMNWITAILQLHSQVTDLFGNVILKCINKYETFLFIGTISLHIESLSYIQYFQLYLPATFSRCNGDYFNGNETTLQVKSSSLFVPVTNSS